MFSVVLRDQILPGYAERLTIEVVVPSLLFTSGNLKAQWSIRLPSGGPSLPGSLPPATLFSGALDMTPPAEIVEALKVFFNASTPGLVTNLMVKAEAAAVLAARARTAAEAEAVASPPPVSVTTS